MHHQHPADELADLRAEIRRLQEREAALRARLLADPPKDPVGRWAQLTIVTERRRRFAPDLLPADIRDDPRYWRLSDVVTLRCDPVSWTPKPRQGWPIRRHCHAASPVLHH